MVPLIRRAALTAILFLGCANPREIPPDLGRQIEPTFGSIERKVLGVYCAVPGCHAGPRPESLLDLEAGRSYAELVNVASVQMPDLKRVEPYRSDRSYLILKLEGSGIVGEVMPREGSRLPPEAIAVIRRWIDAGARPD